MTVFVVFRADGAVCACKGGVYALLTCREPHATPYGTCTLDIFCAGGLAFGA